MKRLITVFSFYSCFMTFFSNNVAAQCGSLLSYETQGCCVVYEIFVPEECECTFKPDITGSIIFDLVTGTNIINHCFNTPGNYATELTCGGAGNSTNITVADCCCNPPPVDDITINEISPTEWEICVNPSECEVLLYTIAYNEVGTIAGTAYVGSDNCFTAVFELCTEYQFTANYIFTGECGISEQSEPLYHSSGNIALTCLAYTPETGVEFLEDCSFEICPIESIVLAVTPANGSGSYTYLWSNGSTNSFLTATSAGTYTVTVTDSNSCTAEATITIIDACCCDDQVFPEDIMIETISPTQLQICLDVPECEIQFYNIIWREVGEPDWNAFSSNQPCMDLNIDPCFNYEFQGQYNLLNPCEDAVFSESIFYYGGFELTCMNILPNLSFEILEDCTIETCLDENLNLYAHHFNSGTSPYTYLWSTGATSTSLMVNQPGNYSVTVTDGNDCIETVTFAVIDTCICTAPIVDCSLIESGILFSWESDPNVLAYNIRIIENSQKCGCEGPSKIVTDLQNIKETWHTMSCFSSCWSFHVQAICADGYLSDWTNVCMPDGECCPSKIPFQDPNQGKVIQSRFLNNTSMEIYPNPVSDVVHIKGETNHDYTVSLVNIQGQKLINFFGSEDLKLNVETLENGIYFLKIVDLTDQSLMTSRLLIQH